MKYNFLFFVFLIPLMLSSQEIDYLEEKQDDYLPMKEELKRLSPKFELISPQISTVQVNTSAAGMNIIGDAANEPSLAINPVDPDQMVIGWRQFDNIESNFRQAGLAYSEDGGKTWIPVEPLEAGLFRSDPVLASNSEGRFYYNSLTEDYSCDVFSTDDPSDWQAKNYAYGGDKQWMVIDDTELNSNGNIYAFWKNQFSDCVGNFTRSFDKGNTFESCSVVDFNPTRGTLAVGPEGNLYACGGKESGFRVLRSESASDPNRVMDWEINSAVDLGGSQALYAGPNPAGMLGQVWIAADHSESATRANVYLMCSTNRNDNNDPCDVMFSASKDAAANWETAVRINDDASNSNWQWFGTMSIAPNGRIDVVWLDTRDNSGTFLSSLYYSNSVNGGLSWSANERLSAEFDPHLGWPNQRKMGDYFHMISSDDFAFLAWAGTLNGEQDVYFSKIDPSAVLSNLDKVDYLDGITVYPNPFDSELHLNISHEEPVTSIALVDLRGKEVMTNKFSDRQQSGMTITVSDYYNSFLNSGIYFLKVCFKDEKPRFIKVVKR